MIFTLHQDPARQHAAEAIPEATAPLALAFPPIWLLWHKLWFELAVYALVIGLLLALLATPLAPVVLVLASLPGLVIFLEGNQWRRSRAKRQGLVLVDVIEADNEEDALLRFDASSGVTGAKGAAPA